jgi:hypothetical protein
MIKYYLSSCKNKRWYVKFWVFFWVDNRDEALEKCKNDDIALIFVDIQQK